MSANLYIDKFGRASMFSAREIPWHGLGQITKGALNSEEAIKAAGLDYEVETAPIFASIGTNLSHQDALENNCVIKYSDDDGNTISTEYKQGIEVPNKFATYRKDTGAAFGVVGSRYTVVQNIDAFSFFDEIVGKGEAIYETAGALGNGEIVFITAKLPDHINVPGEEIDKYLILKSAHDGKGSIVVGFTPVRVVCSNTLNWALSTLTSKISIRHTATAHDKLREASKVMGIANQLSEELGEIFTNLKRQSIMDDEVKVFFRELLYDRERFDNKQFDSTQINNVINNMERFYHVGVGQDSIIGTKFGVYNAVSGYYQNVKTSTNTKKMLESNVFGNNSKVIEKSLTMLLI